MKYFSFVIIVLAQSAYSQQINFTTGIATYALKSMKHHGENLQEEFPVDARFVDKFPAYLYYELSVVQRIRRCELGGSVSYGSTGSRINYTDYSGAINVDQNVRYVELGFVFGALLNDEARAGLFKFMLKPTASFGRYDLIFSTRIGDQSEKEDLKFNSINIGLQPGFSYSRKVFKNTDIQLYAGYNVNLYKGDLIFSEDNALFLEDKDGKKVTLDWSGFRTGLGVTYKIGNTNR